MKIVTKNFQAILYGVEPSPATEFFRFEDCEEQSRKKAKEILTKHPVGSYLDLYFVDEKSNAQHRLATFGKNLDGSLSELIYKSR